MKSNRCAATPAPAPLPKIPPQNDFRIGPGEFGVADRTRDEETGTGVPRDVRRALEWALNEDFDHPGSEREEGQVKNEYRCRFFIRPVTSFEFYPNRMNLRIPMYARGRQLARAFERWSGRLGNWFGWAWARLDQGFDFLSSLSRGAAGGREGVAQPACADQMRLR